jgi:hypothetical protein
MMKEEILKRPIKYPEETKEYWKRHRFDFLATSGLSRRKYCKARGVSCERFNYWFKKLSSHEETTPFEKKSSRQNGLLLPVHLGQAKPDAVSTPLCTVNLKNGHYPVIHHEQALSLLLERWG